MAEKKEAKPVKVKLKKSLRLVPFGENKIRTFKKDEVVEVGADVAADICGRDPQAAVVVVPKDEVKKNN